MRRAPKEPKLVWRQRCPACGILLSKNARVPVAEPGGADLLEQEFRGRSNIVNVRALSYLGDGPYERAFRLRWIDRLRLALAVLLGRGDGADLRRYPSTRLNDVVELPPKVAPEYTTGPLTVHRFGGRET